MTGRSRITHYFGIVILDFGSHNPKSPIENPKSPRLLSPRGAHITIP
jgi:hypothetical protein